MLINLFKLHGWIFKNEILCFVGSIIILEIAISNFSDISQTVWMYKAILYAVVAHTLMCKLDYGCHNSKQNTFQL